MKRLTLLLICPMIALIACLKLNDVKTGNSNSFRINQGSNIVSKIDSNKVLQKALEFQLSQAKPTDSNAYFLSTGALISGNLFGDNKGHAFIVINNYKFSFFEYTSDRWIKRFEIPYDGEYQGFKLQDLNGDNCPDLMLTDFYVYSNKTYQVFIYNCKNGDMKNCPEFEGIMNPFYDRETGLVNSFLFTNHGDLSKETYKRNDTTLDLYERVIVEGLGVEDIDHHKYVIKYYRFQNHKEKLVKTLKMTNETEARRIFDHSLFDYFIHGNQKKSLKSENGWIQME